MLHRMLIYGFTVLAAAPAVARTVSSPLALETESAVWFELRGKPAVTKIWRPRTTAVSAAFNDRKSLVTLTLSTGSDSTSAREVHPRWANANTVAGELNATSECTFRSRMSGLVGSVQNLTRERAGMSFGGGGATICKFSMFVKNEDVAEVLAGFADEDAQGQRPIQIEFEPLVVRTVEDVEVKVPLADWQQSVRRYSEKELGPTEALFALGFTASRVNAVADRLADLGQEGLVDLLAFVRPRFFEELEGERVRAREAAVTAEFRHVKTIVTGEKTYVF